MPGFASNDQMIQAMSNGQTWKTSWGKNFNPTAAAVANEWHTLFRGGGNPGADAIFDAGTNLTFQAVKDNTTSAAAMQHGGNVQPTYYKYLQSLHAVTAAATVSRCNRILSCYNSNHNYCSSYNKYIRAI